MRHRLGIIPDMRAGAVATAPAVTAAFPNPETAIMLPHHRGRLEDSQIRGHSLHNLLGQARIVKSLRKASGSLLELIVILFPIGSHLVYVPEPSAVPRLITVRLPA